MPKFELDEESFSRVARILEKTNPRLGLNADEIRKWMVHLTGRETAPGAFATGGFVICLSWLHGDSGKDTLHALAALDSWGIEEYLKPK